MTPLSSAKPGATHLPASVVSGVRHDLRNPIGQMIGYSELALEIAEDHACTAVREPLEDIRRSAHLATRMLETWLDADAIVTPSHLIGLRDRMLGLHDRIASEVRGLEKVAKQTGIEEMLNEVVQLHAAVANFLSVVSRIPTYAIARPHVLPEPAGADASEATAKRDEQVRATIAPGPQRHVLVVDDQAANREMLVRYLDRDGYQVVTSDSGVEALERVSTRPFEMILLDIKMPGMDGLEVLSRLKQNDATRDIPVIMTSGVDDMETVIRCIDQGADDYLPKPFNPILLRTRLSVSKERKRLRDAEQEQSRKLAVALSEARSQKELSDRLLLNILPGSVAEDLQRKGVVDPMYFADVTIVFSDFVGFSKSTELLAAEELVAILHEYFTAFDFIMKRYGLEKLKTIGDSYMFVGGMPDYSSSHPVDAVLAAVEMVDFVAQRASSAGNLVDWKIRIGVHTGPVIAGVVGIHKFAFDIWGDSVNFSSRMESTSEPNRINLSDKTFSRVKDFFRCAKREKVMTKDGHQVNTYLVEGLLPSLLDEDCAEPTPKAFRRRYRVYFQKDPLAFPESLAVKR
jgi:adenylate cyclase